MSSVVTVTAIYFMTKPFTFVFVRFSFAFAEKAQVFSTRKRSWSFAALHLPKGEEGATGFCKGKSGRKHEMVTCPSVTNFDMFFLFLKIFLKMVFSDVKTVFR